MATAAGSPALLSARGLAKSYGRAVAVAGVDLDIEERVFTTLLGPSGCGKTTILRMIAGFEKPSSGSLTLDGRPLDGVPPERRPVNTVFQSYALFPHLSVADNVAFSLRLRSGALDVEGKVQRALDAVHMGAFAERFPHELSGGQQQRVAVARAIIAEPQILLLDEPLSALDRKMRAHLQIELKDLQRRLGIAFVYVTHDQEEAFALSDRVVVMRDGRIVQSGAPAEIYDRPADSFVADFIGEAALVPGTIRTTSRDQAAIDTPLGLFAAACVPGLETGESGYLVVRPEHLSPAAAKPAISGTVSHIVYQGARSLVEVETAGPLLRYASDAPPPIGAGVGLDLAANRSFITRAA